MFTLTSQLPSCRPRVVPLHTLNAHSSILQPPTSILHPQCSMLNAQCSILNSQYYYLAAHNEHPLLPLHFLLLSSGHFPVHLTVHLYICMFVLASSPEPHLSRAATLKMLLRHTWFNRHFDGCKGEKAAFTPFVPSAECGRQLGTGWEWFFVLAMHCHFLQEVNDSSFICHVWPDGWQMTHPHVINSRTQIHNPPNVSCCCCRCVYVFECLCVCTAHNSLCSLYTVHCSL